MVKPNTYIKRRDAYDTGILVVFGFNKATQCSLESGCFTNDEFLKLTKQAIILTYQKQVTFVSSV
jgi:hypothetical protein